MTESRFFSSPSHEEESIREHYDNLLSEKLEIEADNMHADILKALESEYEHKVKNLTPRKDFSIKNSKLTQKDIEKFREQQEIEFEIKLYSEKEMWKRELMPFMIEECRNVVKLEQETVLIQKEKEIRLQAAGEIDDLMQRVKRDSDRVIKIEHQKLDEAEKQREIGFFEKIKEEALDELKKEQDFRLKEALTHKLKERLEKDIKSELEGRILMEVKLRKEDQFKAEISKELAVEFENFERKIKNDTIEKIFKVEQDFAVTHNQKVLEEVERRLTRREKELNIDYMKKLEKMRNNINQEYGSLQSQQANTSKELLDQEKTEVSRLRAKLNVVLQRVKESRKAEIVKLKNQEEMLERKLREIQNAQRYTEEHVSRSVGNAYKMMTNRSYKTNSPEKEGLSIVYSPRWGDPDEELVRTLPKPLLPPSLLNTQALELSKSPEKLLNSPRKLLNYSNSQDLVSELILKNLEEAKQQAWALLNDTEAPPVFHISQSEPKLQIINKKPNENTLNLTLKSKQSNPATHKKYQDLLNQRHGVIEPKKRLKS